MANRDLDAEAGHVTCEEARDAIQRYHNAVFLVGGEGPRASIPVNPRRDDDIRLEAFVKRVERLEADAGLLAKLRAHAGFGQLLSLVLSWHQTADESRDPIIDPRGHAGEYYGASTLLIQLLRGGV